MKQKANWYIRKDKTTVLKIGNWKALEISKRPHGGYYCLVLDHGRSRSAEGYFGTSLPKKYHAVRYGCKKLREFKLMT